MRGRSVTIWSTSPPAGAPLAPALPARGFDDGGVEIFMPPGKNMTGFLALFG
jgi:hypothetical protein